MILYAIDPGVHACALAAFRDGTLIALTDTAAWHWGPIAESCQVIVEVPRGDKDPRKTNDLIDLNGAGMRLVGQIEMASDFRAVVTSRYARNSSAGKGWKGQIPKPIHHGRLLKVLRPAELAILQDHYAPRRGDPKTVTEYVGRAQVRLATDPNWHDWYKNKIHNGLDAVAFGATEVGRL